MNTLFALTARTLLEYCDSRPLTEVGAACDNVLAFLTQQGVSSVGLRAFVSEVRRALRQRKQMLPALLSTPSGSSAVMRAKILSALEQALATSVALTDLADRTLLGGGVLTVGDERLDGSIRGALMRLSDHLAPSSIA